jgi:hypothetical protein
MIDGGMDARDVSVSVHLYICEDTVKAGPLTKECGNCAKGFNFFFSTAFSVNGFRSRWVAHCVF